MKVAKVAYETRIIDAPWRVRVLPTFVLGRAPCSSSLAFAAPRPLSASCAAAEPSSRATSRAAGRHASA